VVAEDGEFTIRVTLERRDGGGLRAWSADAPGLILSSSDPAAVVGDLATAVETIVGERAGHRIRTRAVEELPLESGAPPSIAGRLALICARRIDAPPKASA
jgi:hypothetical protein